MSADFLGWLPLAAKLTVTAGIVVTASMVAERAGALTGALIATLPVTIWPAYVFLSLNHDGTYIAQAALSGLVINAFTGVFPVSYTHLDVYKRQATSAQSAGCSAVSAAGNSTLSSLAMCCRS